MVDHARMPSLDVAVARTEPRYPSAPPYHPATTYPEYPFGQNLAVAANGPYDAVRQALYLLGLDRERFGKPAWNPLGHLVKPGMRIVIKPNFVLSSHPSGGDVWSIVTHPSVLRAVADYVWIALHGKGTIEFADAPQYNANFEELMAISGLREVAAFLDGQGEVRCDVLDLRNYWSPRRHHHSHLRHLPGDPRGNLAVDLGSKSALVAKVPHKFYGAVYHRQETTRHHSGGLHEYQVSRTMYEADVYISVPKLKVHKKVGVTLNAKGLVGTATNKNYLVHYTLGTPSQGGDQFPDGWLTPWERFCIGIERRMYDLFLARQKTFLDRIHQSAYWIHGKTLARVGLGVPRQKRVLDAGNWYGNDSAWRMAVDLLRSIFFADACGAFHQQPVRRMFSVIDGVIGGDNRGPLDPDANHSGVIIAGEHLLATDLVATRLMGLNADRIKMYQFALQDPHFDFGISDPACIPVHADDPALRGCMAEATDSYLRYLPHPGWAGFLENDAAGLAAAVDFQTTVPSSFRRSAALRSQGR